MNFTSKGTREILLAGCQDQMFKVDVEKGTVIDTVGLQITILCKSLSR
jgi:PAB-dependent poly(A)-specific ribonuclease subunit 2